MNKGVTLLWRGSFSCFRSNLEFLCSRKLQETDGWHYPWIGRKKVACDDQEHQIGCKLWSFHFVTSKVRKKSNQSDLSTFLQSNVAVGVFFDNCMPFVQNGTLSFVSPVRSLDRRSICAQNILQTSLLTFLLLICVLNWGIHFFCFSRRPAVGSLQNTLCAYWTSVEWTNKAHKD